MNGENWLSELAPAHSPPPVSWWPLAPGWWIGAIGLILGVVALIYVWRHPSRRHYRQALTSLKQIQTIEDDTQFAQELELLLRRYALTRFKRDEVARYTGEAWIALLIQHGAHTLKGDVGHHLLVRCYGGKAPAHREAWIQGAQEFFKGCI